MVEKIVVSGDNGTDIEAIGRHIRQQIEGSWQQVLEKNSAKLADAYERAGDMAYGTYLTLLFKPIHRALKQAGLRPKPRFPGDFDISREWGNPEQSDQQRWMWSTIHAADGAALGTIVTITYHDHTQFRVPRQPGIIALAETGKDDVVEALSRRSADFKAAREFTVEYAEYLQSQQA